MRSIRRIPEILRRGKTVKAVVLGPKGSGKTSLITSLYSNLMLAKRKVWEDKNSVYLDLGDWSVTRFELCEEELPRGVRPFDLKCAQSELKRGYYPNATTDWSVLKITVVLEKTIKVKRFFSREKKSKLIQKIVNLEILDLPGERVADFTMVDKNTKNMATFKDWSKRVFDFYDRSSEEYDCYEKAIRNIKPDDPEKAEKEILSAYKTFLSDMSKKRRSRFFTPSTVRLDEKGNLLFTAGQHCFDDWARDTERVFYDGNETFTTFVQEVKRLEESSDSLDKIKECFRKYKEDILCMPIPGRLENKKLVVDVDCRKMMDLCKLGLEEGEFAPLPEFVWCDQNWENWKGVVQRFRKSYERYYSRIMKPLVTWCKDVDQLYYLVDVLTILKDGREALEIQKNFGEMLLGFFSNKISKIVGLGPCLDAMPRWGRSPLKKGCIVATQVDRVVIAKSEGENKDAELDKYAEENKKNIENLAKELFGYLIDAKSSETIVCAAIVSYTAVKLKNKKGSKECYGVKPLDGSQPQSRPVPHSWPGLEEEWEPGKTFMEFGRTDRRKGCDPFVPPPLSNFQLNLVAKSMLGI